MRAFHIVEPFKTEWRDIDIPEPGEGEVLLKVDRVGFCGSDLSAFRGRSPLQRYPMILGHEVGATIEKVGQAVTQPFSPGMTVTLSPYSNCGQCPSCRRGRPNACRDNLTMGVRRAGAMTPWITAPAQDVFPAPDLSTTELALVEPLSVGFHAAARGRVDRDDTVAVFGCGIIGLGAIAAARSRGARVFAIDIEERKLETAVLAGAEMGIDSTKCDLKETLSSLTGGDGPDVIIEAVGAPDAFRAAVELVAFTGRVVYIGYAKTPVEYETKLFVQKELDILGSRNCLGEFKDVVDVLRKGAFPVDAVLSRVVTPEEASEALASWDRDPGSIVKMQLAF